MSESKDTQKLVAMCINESRNPYAVVDRHGPFGDEIVAGYIGTEWEARLFAAAPELLQALKGLLADIEDYQRINNLGGENNHWQVISRAAIAKAEGR